MSIAQGLKLSIDHLFRVTSVLLSVAKRWMGSYQGQKQFCTVLPEGLTNNIQIYIFPFLP